MAGEDRVAKGLSPRVRGNRSHSGAGRTATRSIPACAGEPTSGVILSSVARVYPRVCGEPQPGPTSPSPHRVYPRVCGGTSSSPSTSSTQNGLSPRVRGNRRGRPRCTVRTGSIPACAGEPHEPAPEAPARSPVYPRVCGGTQSDSTPSARGTGSIPACAGEPHIATCQSFTWGSRGLSPRVRGNPA